MSALPFPINGRDEAANWAPSKYRYWYDHIIDLLLCEPDLSQKDIAARLGRHAATIGMVMNSDLFRARYEMRKGAQSASLQEKLNGKLTKVAIEALEITEEVLRQKRHTVPLETLTDVADKALARLGYGPKSGGTAVQVNVNSGLVAAPITAEQLASARARIIEHQQASEGRGGARASGKGEGGGAYIESPRGEGLAQGPSPATPAAVEPPQEEESV